ncbi:hypothetical protein CYMTET_24619 [Cymbomonas tetramitiformis]|uniref:Uncharacterized protein n=1 Tax=Cymbomonas tetramitiformis TaxID=36881 RepID=A0AAE0FVS8_9CHLO|nr:hypothetical protein CYMTET_24619 [Cymbomonas tetramitiformis]
MKTISAFQALTEEQKQAIRDTKPDFRSIWDLIPFMLAGDDQATSPAHERWCAAYEKDDMMASTAFRVLKDISVRDSFQGSVHCKMVADSTTRQNIEDCIKLLRIREYKDRVSGQLRVQFPAPTKVTWKDRKVIVEVQDKLKM